MKKISGFLLTSILGFSVLNAGSLELKQGWNLIGTNSHESLSSILSSLGSTNLEVIQGPSKTYQKAYVDQGLTFLNDFTQFETGKGYWVKLANDASLTYNEVSFSSNQTISLKSGWNLIDPLTDLVIADIKTQLGDTNILVVQGPSKTYQKAYVDQGLSFLNDFTQFEAGKGYWVKLTNDANLTFDFSSTLNRDALDNSGNAIVKDFVVDNKNIKLKVFTNNLNVEGTSNSTISIFGNINSTSTDSLLKLNSGYDVGDKFKVVVYDENDNTLGSSSDVTYEGTAINFGTINITTSGDNNTSTGGDNNTSTGGDNNTSLGLPPSPPSIDTVVNPPAVPSI